MLTLALPVDAHPVCADPKWLPVVDAAFNGQGGDPAAKRLEREACPGCPVHDECLLLAMRGGESGPWGGTSSRWRTKHGGRPVARLANLRGVQHDIRKPA